MNIRFRHSYNAVVICLVLMVGLSLCSISTTNYMNCMSCITYNTACVDETFENGRCCSYPEHSEE